MGLVRINFDLQEDGAHAIIEDENGKLIVVGLTREGEEASNLGIVRLNLDGSPDMDFGDEGFVRTDINGLSDEALGVAIQDDGKIVVAGTAQTMEGTGDFAVARYDTLGVLDPDFGEGGIATIDFFGKQDFVADVEIQADGKIVVTGTADTGSGFDFAVARLTDTGDPDLEFHGDGEVTIDVGGTTDVATASVMHVGQTILIGGHTNGSGSGDFALVRLLSNGDPDDDFGDAGIVKTDLSGAESRDQILDLAVQEDDKIVVTGCSGPASCTAGVAVARYTAGGTLDPTFGGGDGFVTNAFGSTFVQGNGVAIQQDGAIVVAGEWLGGGLVDFLVARYQGDTPPALCGDANASSTISAIDALVTLRTAVGTAQCVLCLCDANGSGSITASDSLLVLKKGVGQAVTMMCPAC